MINKENKVIIYSIEEKMISNTIKPNFDIVKMFPNTNGTKAVCIDKLGKGHILNFLSEKTTLIEGFTDRIINVLWDMYDTNLFIGVEINRALSFIYDRNYYKGE
jgi:WD domain, G-beta repeat